MHLVLRGLGARADHQLVDVDVAGASDHPGDRVGDVVGDEGLGHPRFSAWLDHPTREAHYDALRARYEIVGQTSLAVRDKAAFTRTIAVTDLDPRTCERLGWTRATSVAEALSLVGDGEGARRWGVIPAAATVLPVA